MAEQNQRDQLGLIVEPDPAFGQDLALELAAQNNLQENRSAQENEPNPPQRIPLFQPPRDNNQEEIDRLDELVMLEHEGNMDDFLLLPQPREPANSSGREFFSKKCLTEFFLIISLALYFVLRFALPICLLAYTIFVLLKNSDYYSPAQISVIFYASFALLFRVEMAMLFNFFGPANPKFRIFLLSAANFVIWERMHEKGRFFAFPVANVDLVYQISHFVFFLVLITNLVTIVFWASVILGVLLYFFIKFLIQKYRFYKSKQILKLLKKVKLSIWKKANPEKLKKFLSNGDNSKGETIKIECCICSLDINEESFVLELPKCGHIYHNDCVMEWLDKNPTCPICRNDVIQRLRDIVGPEGQARQPIEEQEIELAN